MALMQDLNAIFGIEEDITMMTNESFTMLALFSDIEMKAAEIVGGVENLETMFEYVDGLVPKHFEEFTTFKDAQQFVNDSLASLQPEERDTFDIGHIDDQLKSVNLDVVDLGNVNEAPMVTHRGQTVKAMVWYNETINTNVIQRENYRMYVQFNDGLATGYLNNANIPIVKATSRSSAVLRSVLAGHLYKTLDEGQRASKTVSRDPTQYGYCDSCQMNVRLDNHVVRCQPVINKVVNGSNALIDRWGDFLVRGITLALNEYVVSVTVKANRLSVATSQLESKYTQALILRALFGTARIVEYHSVSTVFERLLVRCNWFKRIVTSIYVLLFPPYIEKVNIPSVVHNNIVSNEVLSEMIAEVFSGLKDDDPH